MRDFDFIVLGSGIAGLSFALKAADKGRVALVTKRAPADSNTAWAQGGVACVMSDEDSFELHIRDTLEAGAGLCHADVVRTIVTEGPARIAELMELGVHFDHRENGDGRQELDLGREGGHSKRRILHFQDATGREIERTLLEKVSAHPSIETMPNHMAVDFITTGKLGYAMENSVVGTYVLDESTGAVETLRAPVTVLATGGCGKVYLYTT
ncbi:MAG: FAD-dependent oxidoreductase, partial [Terrimicrobiaceae bacterium]